MANPVTDLDGSKRWLLNGVRHRTDGPAIEYPDGGKTWWVNGKLHRTDGPAVECADGEDFWYSHGQEYTFDVWLEENSYLTDDEKVMMKLQYG
jgi:hypothetical protein